MKLLKEIRRKYAITYEILDLSRNGEYDQERERQSYERDFKPRAKILKKRTGKSIYRELRGGKRKKRYYVSNPGTMCIIRNNQVEWFTLGDNEIKRSLCNVLSQGQALLERLCA